jgi:hypothetical protein
VKEPGKETIGMKNGSGKDGFKTIVSAGGRGKKELKQLRTGHRGSSAQVIFHQ